MDNKIYIKDREAATRYGLPRAWFQQQRHHKIGPPFIKLDSGSIFYDIKKTDKWFEAHEVISQAN